MTKTRYKRDNLARFEILIRADSDEPGVPASQFLRTGSTGLGLGKVRPLTEADIDERTPQGKRIWSAVKEEGRRKLLALSELKTAIESDDPIASEAAFQALEGYEDEVARGIVEVAIRRIYAELDPLKREEKKRELFLQEVTALLNPPGLTPAEKQNLPPDAQDRPQRVLVVFWWNGRRFVPALYCPHVTTALMLHTLLRFATGRSKRVCPACHKFFTAKRPNQFYCSMAHRETHRVARYRARKKRQAESAPAVVA